MTQLIGKDMSILQTAKMTYRPLGSSGLKVSVISLGNMINSQPATFEEDKNIIRVALKNGINYFDTAQSYDQGNSQIQLGQILQELKVPRQDVVISTKISKGVDPSINSQMSTNRKHIKESVDQCLERLQLEYLDIVYAHFFDKSTPLEEICRGFHEVIEDGKSFYWGTSNWDADSVMNALAICESQNLHKPIGCQNEYNMLVRTVNEVQYQSLYQKYNFGFVGYGPLAGGFLTGKYLDGITQQNNFPLELIKQMFHSPFVTEKNIKNLYKLKYYAEKELGCKLINVALAWTIKYQHLNSALTVARTTSQLQQALKTIELLDKFTPEVLAKINKILDTTPEPPIDFKNWKPYPPIRPVAQK